MKKYFFAILMIFTFLAFAACSESENNGTSAVPEAEAPPTESPVTEETPYVPSKPEVPPDESETPPAEPEASPELDYRHPFAITLAEFFADAAPVPEDATFPFSTHAVLVDMDGNGTQGVIASRLTNNQWGGFFLQRLFYIYDGELHSQYNHMTVTPGGRLVLIDNVSMSGLSQYTYILMEFIDGEHTPVVAVSVEEWSWSYWYED